MKRRILTLLLAALLLIPLLAIGSAQAAVTPAVVQLSQSSAVIDMAVGRRLDLAATVLPDGASQRVTWTSSNRKIATVSSSGVVTARARGTVTITAKARGTNVSASCTVTVVNSTLPDGISLGLNHVNMERFSTRQLTATVWPSTVDASVRWKSSRSSIVSVDKNGLLTAKKAGVATITCYSVKDKTVRATLTVTVYQKATPRSLTMTPSTEVMVRGDTLQLRATPTPSDASAYVTWRVSSKSRASITADGLLTAKQTGWVTVTATSRQNSRIRVTRKILIVAPDSPQSLSLGLSSVVMTPGHTRQLNVTAYPLDKSNEVRWKSSRTSVVTVSANGLLTAKRAGTATITATSRVNSNVKITLKVTVQNLPAPTSLTITGTRSVTKGASAQLSVTSFPSNTSSAVTWSSSNRKIATVDSDGTVRGVKGGVVTITATSTAKKTVKASYTLTVTDPESPTAITLNTGSFTMEAGGTFQLEAGVLPESCRYTGLKYTSSSTRVLRVSSNGLITARQAGTAVVTVRSSYDSGVSRAIQVTVVEKAAPTALKITSPGQWLTKGQTVTLAVTPTPSSASRLYGFKSSNSSVATVDANGVVTAKKTGTVRITVYSKKKSTVSASITLTVADASTPRAISLPNPQIFLGQNDSTTLVPTISPANASRAVTWKSSNTNVATIGADGTVRARGVGSTVITCTTAVGGLSASCTVTVYNTTLTRVIPARTTTTSGIVENMAKIEAIRRSADSQITLLQKSGKITSAEAALRHDIINRAFAMQAFPWMTKSTQEYWSKAYAYKRYVPGTVYYGLPYIQTAASGSYQNRRYNVDKALAEGRYYSSGKGYYWLNQSKLLENMYVGCDCSSFVSMSQFGTNHTASYLNTTAIYKSTYYNTVYNGYANLRPGDLLVKSGDHTLLFLYYTNTAKTEMMVIEQGGDGSTVICSLYNPNYFSSKGYIVRRRNGFNMN